jgi:hypothetical protein
VVNIQPPPRGPKKNLKKTWKKREQAYIFLFVEKFGCVNANKYIPVFNTNRCGIPTCTIHRHVVLTIVYNPVVGVTNYNIGNAFNAFEIARYGVWWMRVLGVVNRSYIMSTSVLRHVERYYPAWKHNKTYYINYYYQRNFTYITHLHPILNTNVSLQLLLLGGTLCFNHASHIRISPALGK